MRGSRLCVTRWTQRWNRPSGVSAGAGAIHPPECHARKKRAVTTHVPNPGRLSREFVEFHARPRGVGLAVRHVAQSPVESLVAAGRRAAAPRMKIRPRLRPAGHDTDGLDEGTDR